MWGRGVFLGVIEAPNASGGAQTLPSFWVRSIYDTPFDAEPPNLTW